MAWNLILGTSKNGNVEVLNMIFFQTLFVGFHARVHEVEGGTNV
jgi:hypothetical protein